jgi:hypothetical protein
MTRLAKIGFEMVTEHDQDAHPLDYLFQDPHYRQQDEDRLKAWRNDEWHFVGVRAKAIIKILHGLNPDCWITSDLLSPGLWGIENDSDDAYFRQVYQEEREILARIPLWLPAHEAGHAVARLQLLAAWRLGPLDDPDALEWVRVWLDERAKPRGALPLGPRTAVLSLSGDHLGRRSAGRSARPARQRRSLPEGGRRLRHPHARGPPRLCRFRGGAAGGVVHRAQKAGRKS